MTRPRRTGSSAYAPPAKAGRLQRTGPHPSGRAAVTWWAKARFYVALYLVPGNALRCGCHWHPWDGVVRAAHCPKHGRW